ncbi:MAG: exo-alpha-sialidase [Actinobacteria bacterium]|nr:exo-alpha-sialidase [Actinomycetota bacterium]
MRRFLAPAILLLALSGPGAAAGANIDGTARADRLTGTDSADLIRGLGGNDFLRGGLGEDRLLGGPGDDRIAVHYDGGRDTVVCGNGQDIVNADLVDTVGADCEVVGRQLSRDGGSDFRGQHETQVEPDSFAYGRTIVTVFQVGRFVYGGAMNIGFSTSKDAGATWRSGLLPALSVFSTPAGRSVLVTDPTIAYDARHDVWLAVSLAVTPETDEFLVSRSRDGLTWSLPVVVSRADENTYDKEWVVCDNGASSRFRGRCYISYLDLRRGTIVTTHSSDGGLTWSGAGGQPAGAVIRDHVNGAQPIVRPDGMLLVLYTGYGFAFADEIGVLRSVDGGATFVEPERVADLADRDVPGIRAPPLPSVEIDRTGTVYVAWQDCRFRLDCSGNDIVWVRSRNGLTWSDPARVPIRIPDDVSLFTPGLAVDATTSGDRARIAVAYHSLGPCNVLTCSGVNVNLVTSVNAGRTWGPARRLNAEPMQPFWIADSGLGRMLADYISTSYTGGRAIPVFALASPPVAESFRQAIFVATRAFTPARR